jgi:hypothetical protein
MFPFQLVYAAALAVVTYTIWRASRSATRGLCLPFPYTSFRTLNLAPAAESMFPALRMMNSSVLWEMIGGVLVFRKEHESFERGDALPGEATGLRGNHVVIVGSMESGNVVRCALLGEPRLTISIVTNYRELWTIPKQETIHLVVLNVTLSTYELDASCRLIRQRWPRAKILVVHQGEGFLEDALYDDRVTLRDTAEVLRGRIVRLLNSQFDRSRHDAR